jgi:hypothetical protein
MFMLCIFMLCSQHKCGGIQNPFVSLFTRDVLQQSAASSFLGHTADVTFGIEACGTLSLVVSVYTPLNSHVFWKNLNIGQYDSGIE